MDPARWIDQPADLGTPEGRAAAALRKVSAPAPLTGAQLERIEQRIDRRLRQARRGLPGWLKLLIGTGAFAGAPLAFALYKIAIAPIAPLEPPAPSARTVAEEAAPALTVDSPGDQGELGIDLSDPQAFLDEAGPSQRGPSERTAAPAPHVRPAAGAMAAGPRALTALQSESRLLERGIAQYSRERDPETALRTFDEYRRKFPAGQLVEEERFHRLKSLLLLGRRDDALEELEPLSPADFRRAGRQDLQALKAELLYQAGRVPEALPVFEAVLAAGADELARQRALYGRALCHARLGDGERARADLERYLELFPAGRHSAKARELLERP